MRDIAKLDEVALLALGVDKVTVKAFRTILNAVQITLPEVADQTETNAANVNGINESVLSLQDIVMLLQGAPANHAQMSSFEQDKQLAPVAQMAQQVEFLQTEVRQLAEQQLVLMNLINELKQGTML